MPDAQPRGWQSGATRRLRAGLPQDALGERAGLTVDTVRVSERGLRRRLYPHTARAVADSHRSINDCRPCYDCDICPP